MADVPKNDLTIVYYTANVIPQGLDRFVKYHLLKAARNIPIISVSKKPIEFGKNYVVDTPQSHINLYRQALLGAKKAKTKYIAMAEDDTLYSPEHFKYRPQSSYFAYNIGHWGLYTWEPDIFTWKGRRVLSNLICERDAFIQAIEERLALDNVEGKIIWGEPGKYEEQLGLSIWPTETFYTNPANIVFSHETALSFGHLGTRKKLGVLRATEIPYWGQAKEISKIYKEKK